MPSIFVSTNQPWANYHITIQHRIARVAFVDAGDVAGADWKERFSGTAQLLRAEIGLAAAAAEPIGMIGRGWSFNGLVGNAARQLACGGRLPGDDPQNLHSGLSGCSWLAAPDMHPGTPFPAGTIAMVSGGTTFRELVTWAKPAGRSIRTSGSHLGPTVAGAMAAGTHGSRLGFGGAQDQIVGVHLLVGEGRSVWVERASQPVLSDEAAAVLDHHVEVIRDDDALADVLVHLGGMGIINGVALETEEDVGYALAGAEQPAWPDLLEQLSRGDFRSIAGHLGLDAAPAFYELTFDPLAFLEQPAGASTFHTFYFAQAAPPTEMESLTVPHGVDGLLQLWHKLQQLGQPGIETWEDPIEGEENIPRATDFYRQVFDNFFNQLNGTHGWDAIHADSITGGQPGFIYSAAMAVDRAMLRQILPIISRECADLLPFLLFTVRFVSASSATMGFTRFAHSAVIDFEGLSRFGFEHFPGVTITQEFVPPIETALQRVRAALETAGIGYSMHWAKCGTGPDSGFDEVAHVRAGFGPANDPDSRLGRWHATRNRLLEPSYRAVFSNSVLAAFGLVSQVDAAG